MILVREIGLAAFMKMRGCVCEGFSGNNFEMNDPKSNNMDYWVLKYSNSCCIKHDSELLQLRDLVRRFRKRV